MLHIPCVSPPCAAFKRSRLARQFSIAYGNKSTLPRFSSKTVFGLLRWGLLSDGMGLSRLQAKDPTLDRSITLLHADAAT